MIEILIAALAGGFLSRMVGGGWPSPLIPIPAQWLYAAPYGLMFMGDKWGLLSYAFAGVGKRIGHSTYFNLGYEPGGAVSPPEPLVRLFFGPVKGNGSYWRCVFGLACVGMAVTLVPAVIYAVLISPLKGAVIAFTGLFCPAAYMIGWFLRVNFGKIVQPTVIGEVLSGVGQYAVLAAVILC